MLTYIDGGFMVCGIVGSTCQMPCHSSFSIFCIFLSSSIYSSRLMVNFFTLTFCRQGCSNKKYDMPPSTAVVRGTQLITTAERNTVKEVLSKIMKTKLWPRPRPVAASGEQDAIADLAPNTMAKGGHAIAKDTDGGHNRACCWVSSILSKSRSEVASK